MIDCHMTISFSLYNESLRCVRNIVKKCHDSEVAMDMGTSMLTALRTGMGQLCENNHTFQSTCLVPKHFSFHSSIDSPSVCSYQAVSGERLPRPVSISRSHGRQMRSPRVSGFLPFFKQISFVLLFPKRFSAMFLFPLN